MRKNKFKKYIFLLIIPLLFITGISSWIILNNTVFAPSYNPNSTSILFQAFDGQSGTYTKDNQGPISSNDKIKNENVTFSYRKAESNDFYTEGLPINAGTYDILIKDNSKYYVDEVVRYTINKATPICDVTPELSEIYEGEIPTIVNKSLLVFTGINSEEVDGNLSIDPNINYPENSTNTSEKVTVNVNFTSSNPNYSDAVIYGTVDMPAIAYIIGSPNIYYGAIHKAINSAVSGNIVTVIPPKLANYHDTNNAVEPDKVEYKIFDNCTIKENVAFVVPTDSTTLSSITNTTTLETYINSLKSGDRNYGDVKTYGKLADEKLYKRVNIIINENIVVDNSGTLVISGYLSGGTSSAGLISHTSHSYSTITLSKNSKIVQNNSNAVIHCYGYIKETYEDNSSLLNIENGKLYIPFVVFDYRGFSVSWAMTGGAIKTERCAPFNQFNFINVSCKTKLNYYSQTIGVVTLRVIYDSQEVDELFNKLVPIVGNDSSYFIQQTDTQNSYVEYKYSEANQKSKISLYGGNKTNKFELSLEVSRITIDLSTVNSYFPISYRMDINLHKSSGQDSANFDLTTQRFKLLPGSSFTVNNGANVSASEISVYSAFYDGAVGNGEYSSYSAGIAYPLKQGATLKVFDGSKLNVTSIAGTVYGNSSSFSYTNNTITTKEPWNIVSSGSINPPWTIGEYLEIREQLSIQSIDKYSKNKLYVGVNTFTKYNSLVPKFNLIINDSTITESITGYQNVIHLDSINNYRFELLENIYKAYNYSTYYKKNSIIQYNEKNSILCAVNSTESISSNNNGINEFDVQDITISCNTPLVGGKIPLYVGTTIQLEAEVNDINKAYDKTITWSSEDTSIATVDNKGNVTGKAIGKTNIKVLCDGVYGIFEIEVLEEVEIIDIESIVIKDNNGNRSDTVKGQSDFGGDTKSDYHGKYGNNKDIVFSIEITPSDAVYSSITWTFSGTGATRQYLSDPNKASETVTGVESVTVHTLSDTGASDDRATLKCTVVGLNKTNVVSATFIINHQADKCVAAGTSISLADGTQKNVEDLVVGDMVLVYNHEEGKFDISPVMVNAHSEMEWNLYEVIHLNFDNGTTLKIINEHTLFDTTLNKYVILNRNNITNYLNHSFYGSKVIDGNHIRNDIKLISYSVVEEYTGIYNPLTYFHMNCFTNGLLSMPGEIENLINIFEYDYDLKYNEEYFNDQVDKYGLFTYEEVSEYVTKEIFDALPLSYCKIAIGKGMTTWEEIYNLISMYDSDINDFS